MSGERGCTAETTVGGDVGCRGLATSMWWVMVHAYVPGGMLMGGTGCLLGKRACTRGSGRGGPARRTSPDDLPARGEEVSTNDTYAQQAETVRTIWGHAAVEGINSGAAQPPTSSVGPRASFTALAALGNEPALVSLAHIRPPAILNPAVAAHPRVLLALAGAGGAVLVSPVAMTGSPLHTLPLGSAATPRKGLHSLFLDGPLCSLYCNCRSG